MRRTRISRSSPWSWQTRLITFSSIFGVAWLFLEPVPAFFSNGSAILSSFGYWGYLALLIFSAVVTIFSELSERYRQARKISYISITIVFTELGERWAIEAPRDMNVSVFTGLLLEKARKHAPQGTTLSIIDKYDTELVATDGNREEIVPSNKTLGETSLHANFVYKVKGTIKPEFQQVNARVAASYDSFSHTKVDSALVMTTHKMLFGSIFPHRESDTGYLWQLVQLRAHYTRQLRHSYVLSHNFRQEFFWHFREFIPKDIVLEMQDEDFDFFRNICLFITDNVRSSLIEYFKSRNIDIDNDVAVSVKLIIPSTGLAQQFSLSKDTVARVETQSKWVVTVFRDTYTYTNFRKSREVGYRIYDIDRNTAYTTIMTKGDEYFYSNNLRSLELSGGYRNENLNWKQHYNAVLVVPIYYHQDIHTDQKTYYGFLTADSKNNAGEDLYNTEDCLFILRHASEWLTMFFLILALTSNNARGQDR